jgi:hypothetical protein
MLLFYGFVHVCVHRIRAGVMTLLIPSQLVMERDDVSVG